MLEWFSAAVASANAAKDISHSLMTLRDEEMIRSRVFDLTSSLMELQQQLMQAQMEQMQLVNRVSELERQNAQLQRQSNIQERYQLVTLGNGHAHKLRDEFQDDEPMHYCCPICFEAGKRSFLKTQYPYGSSSTMYVCQTCTFRVSVAGQR